MSERVGDSQFLQSEIWEKVQQAEGKKTVRLSDSFFIEQTLPFVGRYWYCPRGPKCKNQESKIVNQELRNILEEANKNNIGWIRIEPLQVQDDSNLMHTHKDTLHAEAFKGLNVRKSPHDMQPRQTFCIDISKSEEDLLKEMKSKTRYNIRLAQKRGVEVFSTYEEKYLDIFYALVQSTSKRAGITPHPLRHYRDMLRAIPEENISLYIAKYKDEIIAANLIIFYEDTAIYLHGGSSDEYRNVMAPFLLQWQAILDAKERGCAWYDFGGVSVNSEQLTVNSKSKNGEKSSRYQPSTINHQLNWAGITRFKLGFSPNTKPLEYPGTYDIILSPWKYELYKLLSRVKGVF